MNNPYMPIPVRVVKIRNESDDKTLRTFDLEFVNPEEAFDYMPGQFCQLSIPGAGEAPFGIATSPTEKGFLRFTVNRVGVFTKALHELQEGEEIGIRGPLGNWYPVEEFKGKNVLIIGGGFALTTLRSLTIYLRDKANRPDYGNITLIYGARRPGVMIYRDELEQWETEDDIDVHLTIDQAVEGWDKRVGFVPTVTSELSPPSKDTWVMLCGPPIMIRYTLPTLAKLGFPPERIYTSLERRMKCGIGKCGRCNIGSQYVCVDGPVFSFAQIEKIPEEI